MNYMQARKQSWEAFDDCIAEERAVFIVCYINGSLRPWKLINFSI